MIARRTFLSVLATGVLAFAITSVTAANNDAEKAQLRERFKERHQALKNLKRDGFVGETSEGYLGAVNSQPLDQRAAGLMEADNADRRQLYTILASELGTDINTVARRNAQRKFEQAEQGEFLRDPQGQWYKKP